MFTSFIPGLLDLCVKVSGICVSGTTSVVVADLAHIDLVVSCLLIV